MKSRLWRTKRERNIFIFLISLVVVLYTYNVLSNKGTWKEDVDGDGIDEVVRDIYSPDDKLLERLVTEEDGTIYRTVFTTNGHILFKWKMIPDPDNPVVTRSICGMKRQLILYHLSSLNSSS